MPLKWIFKNKYKLMAFIIGLYLVVDIIQHKGLTRVLLPKQFPAYKTDTSHPQNKNVLINKNKEWVKAVDSKKLLGKLDSMISGIECDVYFDLQKKIFDVHHDPDNSIGLDLDDLLNDYRKRNLQASIWLDLKNLDDSNYNLAVITLTDLRNKYRLTNKLLVESNRADLLIAFSDSGFYTSYYTPMFNPYQINDEETKHWIDSLSVVIAKSKVNALSGYYFQYPFLHHYFPNYPVLIWAANDRFSLVNWLFKRNIAADKDVFIALYP